MTDGLTGGRITPTTFVWRLGSRYEITIDRVHENSAGMRSETEVRYLGDGRLIHYDLQLNLKASRSISAFAKACAERDGSDSGMDWDGWIKTVVYRTITEYREGDPPVRLAREDEAVPSWLLQDFVIDRGPTMFIGAPGTTKSALTLGIGTAMVTGDSRIVRAKPLRTGPVLMADWELDAGIHRHRLGGLLRWLDLPPEAADDLHYKRMQGPLRSSADSLAKYIEREGIILVIVDSVGKARGTDPNDPLGAIDIFSSVDLLGVPAVLVDHAGRSQTRQRRRDGMGAIYNDAYVRMAWTMESEELPGGATGVVATNWKCSFGRKRGTRTWSVHFEGDDMQISRMRFDRGMDDRGRIDDEDRVAMWQHVRSYLLRNGPSTVKEIADGIGRSQDSVRSQLNKRSVADPKTGTVAYFVKEGRHWSVDPKVLFSERSNDDEQYPDPF